MEVCFRCAGDLSPCDSFKSTGKSLMIVPRDLRNIPFRHLSDLDPLPIMKELFKSVWDPGPNYYSEAS